MRLDEWQKYIEEQFLDDVVPSATVPSADSSGTINPAPEGIEVIAAVTDLPAPALLPEIKPVLSDILPEIEENPDRTALMTPEAPQSPMRNHMGTMDAGAVQLEVSFDFGSAPDPDVALPAFDRYLPTSHWASRPEAIVEDTAAVEIESNRLPTPVLETAAGDFTQGEDDADPAASCSDRNASDANAIPPGAIGRRASRSRARHARNVRPEHVPSGLSAGELWATVPKHVQTLLSLERLEDDQEVAQFSYKRPFQEKRRELIARLLDPILSLEDTARLLNVCPTTVRRYTNKGILTYYRKEPERTGRNGAPSGEPAKETRQRRFRLSDILAFLETQQAALAEDRAGEEVATAALRNRRMRSANPNQACATYEPDSLIADSAEPAKD